MNRFIRGARPYWVRIGDDVFGRVAALVGDHPTAIVTDENVAPLYRDSLGLDAPTYVAPAGEGAKSLRELEALLEFLVDSELDRSSVLVALGGGVVSDLAGLAASLYLRGIDVIHVPTSFLAQVDASVGGKTAVNLSHGKNLAGTFHAPNEVLIDPTTLGTLPEVEYRSGLGEVVKSALIGDGELLELLEREAARVHARDVDLLGEIIDRSIAVKATVVANDEFETGERAVLNLGHTFAHAIEHAAGFGVVPHGIAVGVGLVLALRASERSGRLEDDSLVARVTELLRRLKLATSLEDLAESHSLTWSAESLAAGLRHDKKGRVGEPAFVLPRAVGNVDYGVRLPHELWHELLTPR